ELSYVYGADFFGLGIAASGGDQVRQVLDVAAERREGRDPGEFPEVVSKALEAMPQGWSGLGVTNVSGMLDAMVRALSVDAEIDAEVVEKTRPVLEGVARLLRRYDLEKTVSGFAVQGDRLVNRTIGGGSRRLRGGEPRERAERRGARHADELLELPPVRRREEARALVRLEGFDLLAPRDLFEPGRTEQRDRDPV